jgi:hypothetical protein
MRNTGRLEDLQSALELEVIPTATVSMTVSQNVLSLLVVLAQLFGM